MGFGLLFAELERNEVGALMDMEVECLLLLLFVVVLLDNSWLADCGDAEDLRCRKDLEGEVEDSGSDWLDALGACGVVDNASACFLGSLDLFDEMNFRSPKLVGFTRLESIEVLVLDAKIEAMADVELEVLLLLGLADEVVD